MGCLEWMVQVHRHLRCWFSSASSWCGATTQQLWPTRGRSLGFFECGKNDGCQKIYRGGGFEALAELSFWVMLPSWFATILEVTSFPINLEGSVCRECFWKKKTTRESLDGEIRFALHWSFKSVLIPTWYRINTHSSELFRIRSRFFMFFLFGFLSLFSAMFFPEMFWPSHDSWVIWPLAVAILQVHIIQKTSLLERQKRISTENKEGRPM